MGHVWDSERSLWHLWRKRCWERRPQNSAEEILCFYQFFVTVRFQQQGFFTHYLYLLTCLYAQAFSFKVVGGVLTMPSEMDLATVEQQCLPYCAKTECKWHAKLERISEFRLNSPSPWLKFIPFWHVCQYQEEAPRRSPKENRHRYWKTSSDMHYKL